MTEVEKTWEVIWSSPEKTQSVYLGLFILFFKKKKNIYIYILMNYAFGALHNSISFFFLLHAQLEAYMPKFGN